MRGSLYIFLNKGTLTTDDLQPGVRMHREERTTNSLDPTIMSNNHSDQEKSRSDLKKIELRAKATQSLNSMCLCGSNKKYKNCCLKKTYEI